MARGVSQEERLGAVTVLANEPDDFDPDMENAYEQWREDLGKSHTVATLRVFRIPTNEKGDPVPNARHQAELFSAPLDLYSFEEVINRIRREFMAPGERSMTARLLGIRKRTENAPGGSVFNQIVTVEKGMDENGIGGKESAAEIVRVIQESTRQQMEMLERVMGNRTQQNPIEVAVQLVGTMTAMMQPLLAGIGGGGKSSTKEILEMMALVKGMQGDGGGLKSRLEEITLLKGLATELGGEGGSDDGDTPAGIIKAVSPLAGPIMEALAAFQKNQAEARALAREKLASRKRLTNVSDVTDQRKAHAPQPVPEKPEAAERASPVKESQGEDFMLKMIREQLGTLTEVAAENGDPAPLAAMLIEGIPEEYDEKVLSFLENPHCLKVLESLHPKVKEHGEWFARFHKACLDQFFPEDENERDETGGVAQFRPQHQLTPQAQARLREGHRVSEFTKIPNDPTVELDTGPEDEELPV